MVVFVGLMHNFIVYVCNHFILCTWQTSWSFFLYQEIFVYVIHALTSLLLYVHKVVFMYDALFILVFADLMDFKYIVFV